MPVGLLTFDRARSFPDLYWYVNSPMGTFMILATMSMDGIWPVVRWYVKQDVDDMNKSAVSNRKDLKYH